MAEEQSIRSITFPDDLHEWVIERGTVADSFSGFVRHACRTQQTIEEAADAHPAALPDGWWEEAIYGYLAWHDERQNAESAVPDGSESVGESSMQEESDA